MIPPVFNVSPFFAEFRGELLAVLAAFCWALSASVYKKGLLTINSWSGNLIRSGFASAGFFVVILLKGSLPQIISFMTVELVFLLFFSAFFAFFLGDLLFLFSLKSIGVSKTVPVSSTFPLFAVVWTFLIFRRPISILVILGTVLIVLAIKLISEEQTITTTGSGSGTGIDTDSDTAGTGTPATTEVPTLFPSGVFLALSAAVCWSISIVVLDYLVLVLPPEAVGGIRFLITFLLTTAIVTTKKFTITKHAVLWIGVMGMIILVFGNYVFLEALRLAGSAKVAPISAMYPVISVFLAALFLKEHITIKVLGGTALSFLGVLLVIAG
ncbi:MAG: DMT family transporter [Candidatus Methanofastidiosia archaeon]